MNNIKINSKSKRLFELIEKNIIPNFRKVEFDDSKNKYDFSLKQKDIEYPYSCTMEEGIIMLNTILRNNLKNGYEIATAFGISSLFLGLGFKENNGKLKTIDCYIEEIKNDFIYSNEEIQKHIVNVKNNINNGKYPNGLRIAKLNAELLNIEDNVDFIVGVSPQDIDKNISDKIDFVFIDGGHFGEQPTLDFLAIKDKLAEKCALFFHDNNGNDSTYKAIKLAEKELGCSAIKLDTHWGLTILPINIKINFVNNKKSKLYKFLHLYWLRNKK